MTRGQNIREFQNKKTTRRMTLTQKQRWEQRQDW
jgi:hypothetical protein